MATTKIKDGKSKEKNAGTSNGKGRSIDASKPSTVLSFPDKKTKSFLVNPAANYLKPTFSFSHDICKYGKNYAEEQQAKGMDLPPVKCLIRGRSVDRPPATAFSSAFKARTPRQIQAPILAKPSPKSNNRPVKALQPILTKGRSLSKGKTKEAGVPVAPASSSSSSNQDPIEVVEAEEGHSVPIAKVTPEDSEIFEEDASSTDGYNHIQVHAPAKAHLEKPGDTSNPNPDMEQKQQLKPLDDEEKDPEEQPRMKQPVAPKAKAEEEDTTRKHNFRRGREVTKEEGEAKEMERLNFRKREVDEKGSGKEDGVKESVVLKRQEVQQGKKESAPAYNDVIEETANKLVDKRRSKVLALVGAFETVISLQETESPHAHQGNSDKEETIAAVENVDSDAEPTVFNATSVVAENVDGDTNEEPDDLNATIPAGENTDNDTNEELPGSIATQNDSIESTKFPATQNELIDVEEHSSKVNEEAVNAI